MMVNPLYMTEQPLITQVPEVTLVNVDGNSNCSGLLKDNDNPALTYQLQNENTAHLYVVTPNSMEPDHRG